MAIRKKRVSAKQIVDDYAFELVNRRDDRDSEAKLMAIQTIAYRVGWTKLYNRLRYRPTVQQQPREEKWWQK